LIQSGLLKASWPRLQWRLGAVLAGLLVLQAKLFVEHPLCVLLDLKVFVGLERVQLSVLLQGFFFVSIFFLFDEAFLLCSFLGRQFDHLPHRPPFFELPLPVDLQPLALQAHVQQKQSLLDQALLDGLI
jgi:hypothetical protein